VVRRVIFLPARSADRGAHGPSPASRWRRAATAHAACPSIARRRSDRSGPGTASLTPWSLAPSSQHAPERVGQHGQRRKRRPTWSHNGHGSAHERKISCWHGGCSERGGTFCSGSKSCPMRRGNNDWSSPTSRSARSRVSGRARRNKEYLLLYSIDVPRAITESGALMLGDGQRRGNQFKAASVAARNLGIGILVPCQVS